MPIRIRDVQLKSIKRKFLRPHPLNPKIHGEEQRSRLRDVFGEIGFVGAMIVRSAKKRARFEVLDGHGRMEEFEPDDLVPCLVVKGLSDEEAAKLIATFDTVGDLAEIDPELMRELTSRVSWESEELAGLIEETLAEVDALVETEAASQHREEEAEDQTAELGEQFNVLVQCADETDQTAFLERMQAESRVCRVLNS